MRKIRHTIGLIRVVTSDDPRVVNAHGALLESAFPLSVRSRCIEGQSEGVHDNASEAEAIPKVVELGVQMAQRGVEALYVSCAADPGVIELRETVSIPVIGAGAAAAHAVRAFGRPVGILGITNDPPGATASILGDLMVKVVCPQNIHTTLDLLRPEALEACVEAARNLKRYGAHCLLLGCTGLSLLHAGEKLGKATGLPVFDPLLCAGSLLVQVLSGQRDWALVAGGLQKID